MVTIRTCPSYQEETISAALRQALADIGGLDAYARPGETVLLAPAPYEGLYEAYLSAQIDFHNGEFTRYQNSAQLYNAVFSAFAAWYRREHLPVQGNSVVL